MREGAGSYNKFLAATLIQNGGNKVYLLLMLRLLCEDEGEKKYAGNTGSRDLSFKFFSHLLILEIFRKLVVETLVALNFFLKSTGKRFSKRRHVSIIKKYIVGHLCIATVLKIVRTCLH